MNTETGKIQPHADRGDRLFYGYVLAAASFLLQAIGWGAYNSFGVFFNPLMNEYGWSRAGLSGAFSISFFLSGIASILLGRLNDRVGPRLIMTIGGVCLGVGYLLMSRLTSLWQLYLLYCLLVGFGISGVDVVLLSTIARWFVRLRGRISGILKVGTGVGMLIMPLFTNWLITGFGWRMAFVVMGVVVLVLFIGLSQLLVRDPGRRGLRPDGDGRVTAEVDPAGETGFTLGEALGSLQLRLICMAYFLLLVCVFTVLLHIVPHAIDLGIPRSGATQVLATIGGLSIAGRFIMGFVSDRIGNKWTLAICYGFLCASLVWLLSAGIARHVVNELLRAARQDVQLPGLSRWLCNAFLHAAAVFDVVGVLWLVLSLALIVGASRQRWSISWVWMSAICQTMGAALLVVWSALAGIRPFVTPGSVIGRPAYPTTGYAFMSVAAAVALVLWVMVLIWLLYERARLRRGPTLRDGLRTNVP